MKKATRQQTKDHNTRLVLRTIYAGGEISRADIARTTHLTRPTVSTIVSELIDNHYVIEMGRGPSAGGKRPTILDFDANAHQLLCADLGSQEFRGAVVNLRGEIRQSVTFPTDNRKEGEALQLVYEMINRLMAEATAPVLGIGIGTPGLIDPRHGVIRRAVNLGWTNLPIASLLENQYKKPIYVANDSHLAALAENTFGRVSDTDSLVVIKVGQGIGAGIVLNRQPYYGDGFGAGEVGHVVVVENGARCRCGNFGCLETVASTRAILQQAQQIAVDNPAYPDGVTWPAITAALAAGDEATHNLVSEVGGYLGIAAANLISSLNIHHIVISGRVCQFGDTLLASMRETVRRRVLPAMADDTEISYSALGADIVILGSSAMVLKQELAVI